MSDLPELRPLTGAEIDATARMWASGWRDAHLTIVPEELARLRTLPDFRRRLADSVGDCLIAGAEGAPEGFVRLIGDELDQFYVAAALRGTGYAARLMAAAEDALRARGVREAHLICTVGNDRAARFYAREGWRNAGVVNVRVETSEGPFPLDVWRFDKTL
ncbi:GNAT family N-acetyltransferase [Wenxinia marina]|uniref:Acetyltransferase n=1 Tax=Wenxinia marina DSM 24838 TaxID=1123501 RepID=A0A0D0PGV7_9RHOB|nr:GNAT family N-acetyltransferase [Wenxinia marina]KIQ70571.1 Acetyltransferase [Wenxinia marina DSM 24838]GGL52073.1 hypothetical protein GCM10011392_03010 [Wenxinia marina]